MGTWTDVCTAYLALLHVTDIAFFATLCLASLFENTEFTKDFDTTKDIKRYPNNRNEELIEFREENEKQWKDFSNMFSLQWPQGKIDRVETILDREEKHGKSKENQ